MKHIENSQKSRGKSMPAYEKKNYKIGYGFKKSRESL
jgi:hypothetical protein